MEYEKASKFGLEIAIQTKKQKQYLKYDLVGSNGIKFIEEVEPRIRKIYKDSNRLQRIRKAKFECYCGNEFVCEITKIANNLTKSCGCYQIEQSKKYQEQRKAANEI